MCYFLVQRCWKTLSLIHPSVQCQQWMQEKTCNIIMNFCDGFDFIVINEKKECHCVINQHYNGFNGQHSTPVCFFLSRFCGSLKCNLSGNGGVTNSLTHLIAFNYLGSIITSDVWCEKEYRNGKISFDETSAILNYCKLFVSLKTRALNMEITGLGRNRVCFTGHQTWGIPIQYLYLNTNEYSSWSIRISI